MLVSIGTLEKSSVTNAGWAFSRFCRSNEWVTVASEAGYGGFGGYAGAEYGAEIGLVGGPGGAIAGAVIGAL
ncbi:MAG: hypothetical protein ACWIPJ_06780 [Polaribacter sp.]